MGRTQVSRTILLPQSTPLRVELNVVVLGAHGFTRVWELHEYGPEYELELAEVEPTYTGAEGYWTSGTMDWLIYASHESSITVAGAWLIDALKGVWPAWEQHLYTGWDYESPPRDGR